VDIKSFRNKRKDINFDVFIRLSEHNFAHIFSRSTGLDYKRLAHYLQQGVKELFIAKEDEGLYKEYLTYNIHGVVTDEHFPQEKRIAALINLTEQNLAELFTLVSVPKDTAESAQKLVESYVTYMSEQPQTLALILNLVRHGEYLYYHSVAVSVFSLFLAKASGQFNQEMLEKIGLGGFLHDIGIDEKLDEITNSPNDLTHQEWEKIKEHTRAGLNMIKNTEGISEDVKFIVYQHHEEPSGQGYPNRLKAKNIYYPAKFVAVADAFSALISERPFRKAYTIEEAIEILEKTRGKHEAEIVKLLRPVFLKNRATLRKKAA